MSEAGEQNAKRDIPGGADGGHRHEGAGLSDTIRKTVIGVLATGAFVLLASPALAQVSADTIKIGVLTDLSGVVSDPTGTGSVAAAEIAAQEVGGKVLGKPIEIVSADHQHKADVGAAIARRWYDVENVDVIVDVPNSSVALAVQAIARDRKKVLLVSSAGTTAISEAQCSPYGIQWTFTTYAMAHGTASAVVKAGSKTWYTIASDYAFGKQLAKDTEAIVTANGGKMLGTVFHPLNTSDFASYLLQAQASGAGIIAVANAGGDTINTIKQATEFGIGKGKQKLAAMFLLLTDVNSLGLDAAQGTYLTAASYWDSDEATRAFSSKFRERVGRPPTMLQSGVYGSVLHYLKAVAAAGTDQAEPVLAKMRELPITDAFSHHARIREDGLVVRDMVLAQVKKASESTGTWDYYRIVSRIPGEDLVWPLSESKCPLVKK